VQRKWLYHYDGGLRGVTVVELFGLMLRSPEYSILDTLALALGFDAVSSQMWPEMGKIDFTVQATKLEVPVYFFTGRYDYNTPFVLTERYFDLLDAPQKEIIWFEESAHFMNVSDPDRFQHMLINKVLPETFPTVARQ
jgi:pimeloyl-ACP methyl ester carboxylesterase